MAKALFICSRTDFTEEIGKKLENICRHIEPDNIDAPPPLVFAKNRTAYGIMNPNQTIFATKEELLLGVLFGNNLNWKKPLSGFPDGSFALIRSDNKTVEAVTDPLASRSIWYYHDESEFIAATSQRAIVMYLESFEFNPKIIPWMLSSGSLGPDFSWDKRIKRVPANSAVVLNKEDWSVKLRSEPIEFSVVTKKERTHRAELKKAIKQTFSSFKIDFNKWVLPLSGGFDSRAILFFLLKGNHKNSDVRTITWGLEASKSLKGNDAKVARDLADTLKVEHKYYLTDLSKEPLETIVNRFILMGEGRIDHLSGYMDGFHIWKTLYEDGIEGIIRGDEGFGWTNVSSPFTVRLYTGACLCEDFENLKNYRERNVPEQEIPSEMERRKGETLEAWRDRLYHNYRIPTILAALSDLKLSYVEQLNPLLSREILNKVRELPDKLRTEKKLFRKIVLALKPKIEFAKSGANAPPGDILSNPEFVALLKKKLTSNNARALFSKDFLDPVIEGLSTTDNKKRTKSGASSLKSYLKKIMPAFVKDLILTKMSISLNNNILAFRIFIILKMYEVLNNEN